jgi:ABC-type amino acid transport substrate-binding protein
MIRAAFLTALALSGLASAPARAEEGDLLTGTLKTIRDRGTILIGYRENALPFAFLNKGGQPVGFSVDICRGIAADVARTLNRDLLEPDAPPWQVGTRMVFVPVAADARLPKITAGEIDLECGSTTATAERQKSVAFSPVFFLAGTKLMAPIGADGRTITSYRDLAGKPLVVAAGTTTAEVVRRLAGTTTPPIQVAEVAGLDAAYTDLTGGKAEAFASDDVLLSGFVATRPDGKRFRVVGDFLSFEPYAIILRRDDPAFAALVRQSFGRMASEGLLGAAYNRWFTKALPNGENLGLSMSPQLSEMYRALGQPD